MLDRCGQLIVCGERQFAARYCRREKTGDCVNYQDSRIAAIYDLANPLGEDAAFYLSLAGKQECGVLDLGCGTGTLCCAFAERGHRATGVDPAAAMLAVAKSKPGAERVEWVESSAQTYRSERRFDVIVMTGHAFQIMLADADALAALATMRRHLKARGTVAFETRNPAADWVGKWNGRSRTLSGGAIMETLKVVAADREFISFETSYRVPDGTLCTESRLRFPSREHVESLIRTSGLVVRNVFGDWNGGSFETGRSREMVFVLDAEN